MPRNQLIPTHEADPLNAQINLDKSISLGKAILWPQPFNQSPRPGPETFLLVEDTSSHHILAHFHGSCIAFWSHRAVAGATPAPDTLFSQSVKGPYDNQL